MDVGELLNFKPTVTPKRPTSDDYFEDEPKRKIKPVSSSDVPRKMKKIVSNEPNFIAPVEIEFQKKKEKDIPAEDDDLKKVVQLLEQDDNPEILDEGALKKMLLTFEKRVLKNQELRIKFPDMPEKFMESEIELNEAVQELHAVATAPDLYSILVDLNVIGSIMGLLSHENTDISIAVVDLIQELTDVDTLNESEEGANVLIECLLDHQICALLVQNVERLDESVREENDGVHNTLGIIENILEFKPDVCVTFAQQGLLQWLLKRQKVKVPFDGNKLYCGEILSILLQESSETKKMIGDMDGIDILLQQLAFYKRHDPNSAEEYEFMENLFDCLCSCLMLPANRDKFLKGEGLQLMNLMLREKKVSRNGALKVLNHALVGRDGTDNCNKFVEILGLRTIFPIFMKTPKKQRRKGLSVDEHEEHVCSVLAAMLHNCRGSHYQRIISKFVENDHEKVDRLIELHFKYLERVRVVDIALDKERRRLMFTVGSVNADKEDEFYLRRLDEGLFTLQLIDYIILEVGVNGAPSIRQRIMQILSVHGESVKTIKSIMTDYASSLGDNLSNEGREEEEQRILSLVEKFGN